MKVIRYYIGTEESLTQVEIGWNEANEKIAKNEAYNGEYTIEDDGEEAPTDRIAELEEALDMLLSGVTD